MPREALDGRAQLAEPGGAVGRRRVHDGRHLARERRRQARDRAYCARLQPREDQCLRADEDVQPFQQVRREALEGSVGDLQAGKVGRALPQFVQDGKRDRVAARPLELVHIERDRSAGGCRSREVLQESALVELEVRRSDDGNGVCTGLCGMCCKRDGVGRRLGATVNGDLKPARRRRHVEFERTPALRRREEDSLPSRTEREKAVEPAGSQEADVGADGVLVEPAVAQRGDGGCERSAKHPPTLRVGDSKLPDVSALRIERDDDLLRVTLARSETRNAFDAELIAELAEAFVDVGKARAVLLGGDGPSFCAGADVEWMRASVELDYDANVADATALRRMLEAIDACPVPVVARVQGHALGGGAGLVACADVAVAERGAVFAFSEVKLGIIPAVISPFALAKIGASAARRYFVTGERFDAATALRIGLVHEVADDLDGAVDAVLGELRSAGPRAARHAKRLVLDRPDAAETARRIAERRTSEEGQEGLRAFLERRRPGWRP